MLTHSARCSFFSSTICCPSASQGSTLPHSRFPASPCWCLSPLLEGRSPSCAGYYCHLNNAAVHLQSAANNQGHALLVAENRKLATHAPACQAAGISFIPLAIESLGGLSDATNETISSIGRLIGQHFGVPPHEFSRHLFQRLAVSLWRGNATAWIHRCRPPAPFIDGVVWYDFFVCVLFMWVCSVLFLLFSCFALCMLCFVSFFVLCILFLFFWFLFSFFVCCTFASPFYISVTHIQKNSFKYHSAQTQAFTLLDLKKSHQWTSSDRVQPFSSSYLQMPL